MILDTPPPLWMPPRPAIIRPADMLRPGRGLVEFGVFPFPTFSPSSKPPLVSFRGSLFSATQNVRTYSSTIDLGTADPSRLIIVATACVTGSAEAPTGCTVDGAAATLAVQHTDAGVFALPAQLWYVARPTGGSVTVAVNKPGGGDMDGGAFAVWAVYFLKSTTPQATASDATVPLSLNLTVPNEAAVFAVGTSGDTAASLTFTGVTADANNTGGTSLRAAFGSAGGLGVAAGSRTITLASSSSARSGVSACWR